MTPETVIDIFRNALFLVMTFVGIIVVPSLIIGLIVSTFQAATQINEQTLSFLPRLMVTLLAVVWAGPWMLKRMLEYSVTLIRDIPLVIG